MAGSLAKGLWNATGEAARIGAGILEQGTDLLKKGRIPNPVDPIRDGVGSVLDGILGNPPPREEEPPGEEAPGEPAERPKKTVEKDQDIEQP
ncbi:MAG: hypothetical protein GWO24_32175 [Akkermansiaceae bacterium]|nr:hypothetical protein [Akkermansiaceae bacterium]